MDCFTSRHYRRNPLISVDSEHFLKYAIQRKEKMLLSLTSKIQQRTLIFSPDCTPSYACHQLGCK